MQHPPELKTKFLELRAQGVSYGRIAEAIGVSKPTLIQWGKALAEDIADLQEAQRELVREKLLGNFEQWLGRQVHHFNRLDEEFGRREFKYSPTESVFRMMMTSRKLLDRYFFEDDRPSRRRASEGRAPSSPAATSSPCQPNGRTAAQPARASQSEIASHSPTSESESRGAQTARDDSSAFPSPVGEGQGEGDSRSFSVGPPQPSADSALDGAYSENPAKTQPFPGQDSGGDNQALSSPPTDEVGRAVPSAPPDANVNAQEPEIENRNSKMEPSETTPQPNIAGQSLLPGAAETQSLGRSTDSQLRQDEGQTGNLIASFTCHSPEPLQSETPNPKSATHDKSQLTTHDSPEADFGGESVPTSPYESTREWLERQGIQVSKIPEGAPIITA